MMATLAEMWRHPIKSHSREAISSATLTVGETLPWDRHWAVVHDRSDADGTVWARCTNFIRTTNTAALMAITSKLNEESGTLTLHHPERPDLTFQPNLDPTPFFGWISPLMAGERNKPTRLVRAKQFGMTDSAYPSISLYNSASHRAVSQKMGRALSIHRWRGNLWLDGLVVWEEFDWIGKQIRIGTAVLEVTERIGRCSATAANPTTGLRDANMLGVLNTWGHRDFGVYASVVESGVVAVGNTAVLI